MNDESRPATYTRSLHWLAILVALATFPLVFVGGAVTSKNAGLAVPDWPLSFGQVNPPRWWQIDNVRYEHGHRLLGATVGLLTIALTVWTLRTETRRGVRRLGVALLAAVIVQGVMGGLRVRLISEEFAVVHGCFAQVFFCMAMAMVAVTSRRWLAEPAAVGLPEAASVRRNSMLVAGAMLIQLVLGAMIRHLGVGLLFHIFWAVVVTLLVAAFTIRVLTLRVDVGEPGSETAKGRRLRLMAGPVHVLAMLVVMQLVLGPIAWFVTAGFTGDRTATLIEWLVPTAHVAVGAIALAMAVNTAIGAYRSLRPSVAAPSQVMTAGAQTA